VKFDKKKMIVKITNNGTAAAYLTSIDLNWPFAVNGTLNNIKLAGDDIYPGAAVGGGSVDLLEAQLVADQNKRKIDKGKSEDLTFEFQNNASKTLSDYFLTVAFGAVILSILP